MGSRWYGVCNQPEWTTMQETLTPAMRAFLDEPRFAVVTTLNRDGSPHMTVLWYDLQGNEIVMNAERHRQKIANLRCNPHIGLTVEDAYRYISVYGMATLVDDPPTTKADIYRLAIRYCGPVEGQRLFATEYGHEQRITIRLPIQRMHTLGFGPERGG
ncbi:MAG: PPOX class F420-dependent oxidoreductase [Chloroflexaceae bacterium]|nr:PPOX class F420-dependent oxidoreductase [Chloroflexaceae bacterium]